MTTKNDVWAEVNDNKWLESVNVPGGRMVIIWGAHEGGCAGVFVPDDGLTGRRVSFGNDRSGVVRQVSLGMPTCLVLIETDEGTFAQVPLQMVTIGVGVPDAG